MSRSPIMSHHSFTIIYRIFLVNYGGRGSRVVKVSDRGWPCHEFEPITAKDPPCGAAMHVKSVESSNIIPMVWCGSGSVPGVKTVQVPDELVGKLHRTAELPQAAAVPVAQSPVIQATDPVDPARIESIKAVKTIKAVASSGSNSGKTRFSLRDSQLREPTARPVVKETVVAAIKSDPVLVTQQNIKTVVKKSDPSKIRLTQQRFNPLDIPVFSKGNDILAEGIQSAPFTDGAKEIIVYEDGTTVEVRGSNILGQDLPAFTGHDLFVNRDPLVSYSQRERGGSATIFRAGSINKVKPVQVVPKATPSTQIFPNAQRTAGTPSQLGLNTDILNLNRQLQKQSEEELKRTLAGIVNVGTNLESASLTDKELADIARRMGSGAPAPAPIAPASQQRRPDIVQRIKPAVIQQRVPVATRPQVLGAGIDQKVRYTAGRVTEEGIQGGTRRVTASKIPGSSTVGQDGNVFILGNAPGVVGTLRTGSQGIPKPKPKVSPQALVRPQITAAQALPQPVFGADIAELNRQLQMQSEEELKRTLAGIVNVDANIQGASLSEKELADISRRIGSGAPVPVVPAPQQRRPDIVQRIKPAVSLQKVPVAPRPQVVGAGIDQKVKYTAGRVTAGGIQGGSRRITAGQIRGSGAVGQGENVFILGNAPGAVDTLRAGIPKPKQKVSPQALPKPQITTAEALPQPGLGADITELNRQIQMQSEEELKRTLAGIVNVDANIQDASLSEKKLADISRRIGSGAPAPVVPAPQQRRPDQVQSIKPQRVPIATRPQVLGAGIDQKFKYTPVRVTTGGIQGGSRRVTAGQIRGSSATGQGENVFILGNAPGTVGTLRTGIPKPKLKVSPQALPKPQITMAQALPQPGLGADIAELNRQLQMQSEEELKRTLSGIVNVGTNLESASLSDKELADIARRMGSGAPAPAPIAPIPQQRRPDIVQRVKPAVIPQRVPVATRPQVLGAGIDQKVRYTAGRVTEGGIQGGTRRVTASKIRGSSAVGQDGNVFILGNAPGAVGTLRTGSQGIPKPKPKVSPQALVRPQITAAQALPQQGFGADIAELNRQLQLQSEEELKRTLAGIVNVDANIQGASLSDKELADISRRIGSGARAPVAPAPQQRKPDQIQRIKPAVSLQKVPVAPQPQVVRAGIDQKVKYTAGRVSVGGIQGGSIRVPSGQMRGSNAAGQGESVFILGKAPGAVGTLRTGSQGIPRPKPKVSPQSLPKPQITISQALSQPGLGADIVQLNRQLQMQSEEELKRTLAGVVNVDATIQGTSLSDKELADISKRIGSGVPAPVVSAPQQRRPDQVQSIKPQRVPVATRPQVLGAGIDQKVKYTAGRVTADGIHGGTRVVTSGQIRGSSAVGQGGNVFILGNAPSAVGTLRTGSQVFPKAKPNQALPKPQITVAQALPQPGLGADIVELNRQLQLQSEEELKRTLAGIINVDANIQGASLSDKELADISRRIGSGISEPLAPAPQLRKPDQVLRIKPAVSPQKDSSRHSTSGGTRRVTAGQISGSSATGQGPQSGVSDEVIQINRLLMLKQNEDELRQMFSGVLNSDLAVDKISLSAEDLKDISRRFGADMNEPVLLSTPLNSPNQASSLRPGSQGIASSSLTRTSSDALRQRFGSGVMKVSDEGKRGNLRVTSGNQQLNSKASGAAVTAQFVKDGQQILGQDRIETPIEIQQNVEPNFPAVSSIKIASNKITQIKESSNKFSPVEQSKVAQTILVPSASVSQTFQSTANNDDVNQLQVKVDDVIEQSRLPKADTIKQISNLPLVQSKLALESFSQKYLQEKVPVTIPGYVPPPSFMSPFNYRVPHIRTPIMQQQERLDQILV
ncbi:ATP-grasp domain-containing protein [Trichonephila clavipes]|nr:ATP-grasp domain-containing protein [Trichonephila clavipes]